MRFDSTELEVLIEEAYKHPNDLQRRNINITQRNLILEQHLCQSKRHREIKENSGGTKKKWQDPRCRTNAKLSRQVAGRTIKSFRNPWSQDIIHCTGNGTLGPLLHPPNSWLAPCVVLVDHCDYSWEARNHIKSSFGSLSASSVAGTFKDLPILLGVIVALNHLIANLLAAPRCLGSFGNMPG